MLRHSLSGRAYRALALLLASLLSSGTAFATYTCAGPVVGLTIGPQGVVSAEQIAGIAWVYVCELDDTVNNTSPETCRSIYAMLRTAQTTGKEVRLWFDDSLNCSTHPSWAWLQGWYWGPQLVD